MTKELLAISHSNSIFSIPIDDIVRGVSGDTLNQIRVAFREEVAHDSVAADGAGEVVSGGVGVKSGKYLVVVELFEEAFDLADEVGCAGALSICDIVGSRSENWSEAVVD